jgi:hypothetical protein
MKLSKVALLSVRAIALPCMAFENQKRSVAARRTIRCLTSFNRDTA